MYFYAPEIEDSVMLSFCPLLWNLNLANNFWTVSAKALIFHVNIPCDKTFLWVPIFLTMWPWPWSLNHFFENFNLANNSRTVSARTLIFNLNIPCDKTFQWVPLFLTLWPWLWSLTQFLKKNLTLLITFEQWVLELGYFTWLFPGIRPFCGYHYFLPCDLDFGVWPFFKKLYPC